MATQDENTDLKPASNTTPDLSVVSTSTDITSLDERCEDGEDGNPPPSKSKSIPSIGENAVVEPPLTAEPPTERRDGDNDVLPPNSAMDAKDDDDVVESSSTKPPKKRAGDNDSLPPSKKSKSMHQQTDDEDCKSPSTTELRPPLVKDFKDFDGYTERTLHDEKGQLVSIDTFVMLIDPDSHAAWVGTVDAPNAEVNLEQAVECLCRVPGKAIYPPVAPGMQTIAVSDYTPDDDDETWLKRPLIRAYTKGNSSSRIAGLFLDEIKAHQVVEEHPHRNLVRFKGCLEKDGLAVGVLQERYRITLRWRVEGWSQPPYDATAFYNDIEASLRHLHSLGYAHNDLTPNNVMADAEDRLVIIDLGSAVPLGQPLFQGGTWGWNDGFEENSSVANDEIGLRLMKKYLEENRKEE